MSVSEEQLLAALAEKFLAGTATALEQEQLHQLYDKWIDDEETVVSEAEHAEELRVEILHALKDRINQSRIVPFYKRKLWRMVAAASIIIIAGVLFLYFNQSAASKKKLTSKETVPANHSPILPGKDRAILTLADGRVIDLDSSGAGLLAQQGNTSIINKDGKIIYGPNKKGSGEAIYNTISTPRGGQYRLVLPDGSKVWLNATSSIKFPVAFTGSSRAVELNGEAYFEVAKNPARPFVVKVKDVEVKVLGTHFNVMAYSEEGKIATTLLEGSVHVSKGVENHVMVPGQQAVWKENGEYNLDEHADLEEIVSWKNGKFHFNNADIKVIMRQIARWYDVDVEYRNISAATQLGGVISRKEDLRQLLNYFEIAGKVHFTIEGRKIIVTR